MTTLRRCKRIYFNQGQNDLKVVKYVFWSMFDATRPLVARLLARSTAMLFGPPSLHSALPDIKLLVRSIDPLN